MILPARAAPVIGRAISEAQLAALGTLEKLARSEPRSGALTVSGFLSETLGIGRGGQLSFQELAHQGLNPTCHELRDLWPHRSFSGAPAPCGDGGVWVIQCNPFEAVMALSKASRAQWRNAYRIGYWAWELPKAPNFWLRAASLFHEIWVPSQFVADALANAPITIRVMPPPVRLDTSPMPRPSELADGVRYVLAAGDLRSSLTRKNLEGAIDIYLTAYPEPQSGQRMLIKLVAPDGTTPAFTRLRDRIAARPDLELTTRDMPMREVHALIAHADVLLHPHRSEGYGMMIAEAAMFGTPPLATGWSGNMEFMKNATNLHIPAALVPAHDPDGVYADGLGRWAEPDIRIAAEKLRALLADPSSVTADVAAIRARIERLLDCWSTEALAKLPLANYLTAPVSEISPSRETP